jgi:DUF4097 and DUF4098 domain-containing protein YvlB
MTTILNRVLPCVLLLLAPALARADKGTPINESLPAQRGGVVSISNISGSVTVSHWANAEVQVTGTLGKGSERLRFDVDGDQTEIEVVLPKGRNNNVQGTDLIVRVPDNSELEIAVVSANVTLEADAGINVAAVSGDINVKGSSTDIDVAVVSGEVKVLLSGELEEASIASVSGDVTLAAPLAANARIEVETVSGDVDLGLPENLGARFKVETFSGKLHNKMTNDRAESSFGMGANLSFSTGGRARVSVQTVSGNVLLDPTDDFNRR